MSIFPASSSFEFSSHYIGTFFSLAVTLGKKNTTIFMHVQEDALYTAFFPKTYAILQHAIPTILLSQCYNEKNLPFYEEVLHTEIGHLFEHILLEYLCEIKLARGDTEAIYAGKTNWDWRANPFGSFQITVSSGQADADLFPLALEKSIMLLHYIFRSNALEKDSYNPIAHLHPTPPLH